MLVASYLNEEYSIACIVGSYMPSLSVSCINSMHQYALFMQVSPGGQVLLDNSERYGLYLARSLNDTSPSQLLSRKNIGIETYAHLKYLKLYTDK